jgi:hypothetical protein
MKISPNMASHLMKWRNVFRIPDTFSNESGDIYWLIGKTEAGRLLQVGYREEENKTYFVFHAMAARDYEHRQYKTRGK